MSRFLDKRFEGFKAYEAGEQPGPEYIRLNTNESPFPPSPKVKKALAEFDTDSLRFYEDPMSTGLRKRLADKFGLEPENIMPTNGSDDVLNYFLTAFGEIGETQESEPSFVFPDITYNFYEVLCGLHGISYRTIPLEGDMTIDPEKFMDIGAGVVIPNPNAPTGILESVDMIEDIVKANPDSVVMIHPEPESVVNCKSTFSKPKPLLYSSIPYWAIASSMLSSPVITLYAALRSCRVTASIRPIFSGETMRSEEISASGA